MKKSYGIEYVSALESLLESEDIGHIQVSIPGKISVPDVLRVAGIKDTIVHSNLLNVFGDNDWDEIKKIVSSIRKINPVFVIEHFTVFRDQLSKCGIVTADILKNKNNLKLAEDNISRYRDLLGCDISLENIPITESVDLYFEYLSSTIEKLGLKFTCDLSHLILSNVASRDGIIKEIIKLSPVQVHISNIAKLDGKFFDSHHGINTDFISFAKKHFKEAKYFTWEQATKLSAKQVSKGLKLLGVTEERDVSLNFDKEKLPSIYETNRYLTNNSLPFKSDKVDSLSSYEVSLGDEHSHIFEKYFMFANPYKSLSLIKEDLVESEYLKRLFTVIKLDSIFRTWTDIGQPDIKFNYSSNNLKYEICIKSDGQTIKQL